MLISDKLKSFDFTYAEKEIVKYFLNQKKKLQDNQHVKYQRDCIVRHHQ